MSSSKQKGASKHVSKSSSQKAQNPSALIAQAKAAAFCSENPAQAFAHFQPLAQALPTQDLPVFTGQAMLMRTNIQRALSIVEPYLPKALSALREPKLEDIFELPSLVIALDFAVGRVPVAKLSKGEIEQMLSEGAPWRELLLRYLEVVSHPLLNLVPQERVAAIRSGTGKLDQAQDFTALPGLFAEYAGVLSGKHPFPAEKIDLLATLGGALLQQVKPGRAAVVSKRTEEAILRDQFAQLVADRYDRLQVLATVALGKRQADALLPALRSGVGARRAEGEVEA